VLRHRLAKVIQSPPLPSLAAVWVTLLLIALALLLMLSPQHVALAQTPWTTFTARDGLLGDAIHCLYAAPSGDVWAGTSRGLNRWDGRRWISYTAGNGAPEGYVTAIVECDGALWVGSWGGGLRTLADGVWITPLDDSSSDWISALASDGERLWIATYGRGLIRWQGGAASSYTRANSVLPSDWLTCLAPDGAGGVWVGTERAGLAHLDGSGRWAQFPLPWEDVTEATALALAGADLWVGASRGVAILDTATLRWRADWPDGSQKGRVMALAPAPNGGLWAAAEDGLTRWDGTKCESLDGAPPGAVSALAVDEAGRLWVGYAARGVAVNAVLDKPDIARLPVVLVHGWRGPDSDRLEDSEFWHLARWLREDGFTPYYATDISPANTLYENALRLREVITQARRETGAEQVYLLAFSMGGLNARAYLESTLYQGDVARALILGTPHRGEEIWQPLLLWEHLAWADEPSALELTPAHAAMFNRTHSNIWGVPYTLIAGDARQDELPTLFRELPPSDGLVSTWSALGSDEAALDPGVDRRVTRDIHAWGDDTILLGLPSLLLPRDTYDAHIRPYLFGAADAPGVGSTWEVAGYTQPAPEARTALRAGSLAPGEAVTLTMLLESAGRARVDARWKGAPLEMTLYDPQGRKIESGDEAEYFELDFADFASWVLTDTLPGLWQIVLAADADAVAPSKYVTYATLGQAARLTLESARTWYRPGAWAVFTATLTGPSEGVAWREAQMEVFAPDRSVQRVTLTGGPVFTASLALPDQSGYYVALARAVGERDGQPLERGAELVFGVMGDAARLTGQYDVRSGARGQQAVIGVTAQREGDYLISVQVAPPLHSMERGQGVRLPTIAQPIHLAAGKHDVIVALPGGGLYHLARVTLCDLSGAAILLDETVFPDAE